MGLACVDLILLVFLRRKVNGSPRMWKPLGKFEWPFPLCEKRVSGCFGHEQLFLGHLILKVPTWNVGQLENLKLTLKLISLIKGLCLVCLTRQAAR